MMRLGNCRLSIHPLFPLILLFAILTGMKEKLLTAAAALALHEAGHLLAAKQLHLHVDAIEMTPLGGLMTIANLEDSPSLHQFVLAASGPFANLIGCVIAPVLYRRGMISFDLTGALLHANLTLLLINLLPAPPLDGGKMLQALFTRFSFGHSVFRWTSFASTIIGLVLCGLTFLFAFQGKIVFAPAFIGLYLIYAATVESRHGVAKYVTNLISRRQKLEKQKMLQVETVAAGAGMPVYSLLYRLTPGKYHLIHVLSPDGMTRLGIIEEKEFCEAVLSQHDASLGAILTQTKTPTREITLSREHHQ